MKRSLAEILTLVILAAIVTLPNLTASGLSSSEGHRVVTALEILETGSWAVPTMFEQVYLRKPQGVYWVFAAALSVIDDPVLAPRLVSAIAFTLTALGAWCFARRWFGRGAGFISGAATLLTPVLWLPARAAEIESLNNLFAALCVWLTLELVTNRRATGWWGVGLCLSTAAMLLVKGPAGAPGVLGVVLAAAVLGRSLPSVLSLTLWVPLIVAAGAFALWWRYTLSAAGPDAVLQAPSAFMFEGDTLLKRLGFVPVALVSALPMSLAAMFPWGPDALGERGGDERAHAVLARARTLTLGVVLALALMLLMGVSNERYAQPVFVALGPVVGWLAVWSGLAVSGWSRRDMARMRPHRVRFVRAITLGSPWVLGAVLVLGSQVYAWGVAPSRSTSGREAGQEAGAALAEAMPTGEQVLVADAMVEARPEVLFALRSAYEGGSRSLRVVWDPGLDGVPPDAKVALIRVDDGGSERGLLDADRVLWRGSVHLFTCELVTLDQGPEQGE